MDSIVLRRRAQVNSTPAHSPCPCLSGHINPEPAHGKQRGPSALSYRASPLTSGRSTNARRERKALDLDSRRLIGNGQNDVRDDGRGAGGVQIGDIAGNVEGPRDSALPWSLEMKSELRGGDDPAPSPGNTSGQWSTAVGPSRGKS